MSHSSSHDYSRSEINFMDSGPTPGQITSQSNRRQSWDDVALLDHTWQDWDHHFDPSAANKSQNPSPKLGSKMGMQSIDLSAISPLSAGLRGSNDSETDDQDSSASSVSPCPSHDRLQNIANRRGSRHSRDENENIRNDNDNDDSDDNEETSDEDNDDDYEEYEHVSNQISVSLDAEDEFEEGRMQIGMAQDGNIHNCINTEDEYDRYARGQTFISMELQLIAMNEKVAALMNEVNELKQRNVDLEVSKLQLIKNTANAMNDCKKRIKHLCVQNSELLKQINLRK